MDEKLFEKEESAESEEEKINYKELLKEVTERLAPLQQKIKAAKIPVIVLFEGWGASGKGYIIEKLISQLDPRGCKVFTTGAVTEDEKRFPLMRRYWAKIPEYGWISVFDRSWYRDVSISAVEDGISDTDIKRRFYEINDMEKQLTDDGYVLLKFFLRISKNEQKKRFEELENNPATSWRVTADDWRHHRMYGEYEQAFDKMIKETNSNPDAQWITVNAKNRKKAAYEVCCIFEKACLAALAREKIKTADSIRIDSSILTMPIKPLSEYDLSAKLDNDEYKQRLKAAQDRLFYLHNLLYRRRIPLIIVYEGWDAAGKGGNIKRLTEGLDPRGYEVIPTAAPTPPELYRQYLWRFWNSLPKSGHIAIYDRSWYGRVMVERLEGFCTEAQWKRAFDEMNHFELSLRKWGAIIIKLWLQIDKDEQLARFTDRQNTPEKQWKITDEDWRNREKWDVYEVAVNDMLKYTNTDYAPWVVIESNDKKFARVKAIETVVEHIEKYIKE